MIYLFLKYVTTLLLIMNKDEQEHSFAITTNFKYNPIPNGYREIAKEEYERLQEELNAQKEKTTTE